MTIKLTAIASDPLSLATDLVVIGVAEGASIRDGILKKLATALGSSVARVVKREEFTGKKDQQVEFAGGDAIKPGRVVLFGLGSGAHNEVSLRNIAARAGRLAQSSRATSLGLVLPAGDGAARAIAEGVVLGAYRFTKYLTGDRLPKADLGSVSIGLSRPDGSLAPITAETKADVERGGGVARAVYIARDLINEPPNELYPDSFAKYCQKMCRERGLKCTVLDDAGLKRKGMTLMLAVGQGSERESRLIHMVYTPKGKPKGKVAFVGKGLTFDSGGLCIKPAPGMEEMKGDMGGAANVAALMAAVALLKPDVEVHGLIGSVENMPDGNAYRPGDIFGSLDGKKVEIINTDAEGRLVLADVLAYARELKPDYILDNATLTGAIVIALGPTMSGFYANRDELVDEMKAAAKASGEQLWHMPLIDELRDGLKSDWADLKHTADRWGGSITAALFLREFVGDTPWIHVDIAGPSMYTRATGIYAKGGTGHGVLTFLKLIERHGQLLARRASASAKGGASSKGGAPAKSLKKAAPAKKSAPKAAPKAAKKSAKPAPKAAAPAKKSKRAAKSGKR